MNGQCEESELITVIEARYKLVQRIRPRQQARAKLRALAPTRRGEPPPTAATQSGLQRAGQAPSAELWRRVFATDVLSCPCGGRRSVVAVVGLRHGTRCSPHSGPCTPATFAPEAPRVERLKPTACASYPLKETGRHALRPTGRR